MGPDKALWNLQDAKTSLYGPGAFAPGDLQLTGVAVRGRGEYGEEIAVIAGSHRIIRYKSRFINVLKSKMPFFHFSRNLTNL